MKRLLNEDVTRKFMKLANIEPLAENFLEKSTVEEGKAGDQGRSDVANKVPAGSRWLKEEEDVTEEGYVTELEDEELPADDMPADELPPMEDEPADEMPPMEDEPPAPGGDGDLDITSIVQAVTDALSQELEAQGHPVDIDVADEDPALDEPMDDMPADEPMDDMPPAEPAGEEELAEAAVEEELEEADITVSEDLDEETVNEVTRRVAARLLKVSKKNK